MWWEKYVGERRKSRRAGDTVYVKPFGNQVVVEFSGVREGSNLDFFPEPPENVVLNHGKQSGNSVVLSVDGGTALTQLKGVAVVQANGKTDAFEVELRPTAAVAQGGNVSTDLAGMLQAIGFALIGGLILNVMPCVLPVISLKIFGFVSEAGERPDRAFRLSMAFSFGILICFAVLAIVVVVVRATGAQVGWGVQFQDDRLIAFISCLGV